MTLGRAKSKASAMLVLIAGVLLSTTDVASAQPPDTDDSGDSISTTTPEDTDVDPETADDDEPTPAYVEEGEPVDEEPVDELPEDVADEDSAEDSEDEQEGPAPEPIHIEERELPDYDGRGDEPVGARGLLWVPRILMSPLYFLTEFVIRRPLGWTVTSIEEVGLPARMQRLFSFGEGNRFLLAPAIFFDLGFRPNIGIYFGVDNAFTEGNTIRLNYSFGGLDWHSAAITDRYQWGEHWEFSARTRFTARPDQLFYGLGTGVDEDKRSGYGMIGTDTEFYLQWASNLFAARLSTDMRYRYFREDAILDNPTLEEYVESGQVSELPPGYEDGYLVHGVGLRLSIDTRPPRPEPTTGVELMAKATYLYSLRDPSALQWVNWGGGAAAHVDLTGYHHALSFSVVAELNDVLQGEVPFTEQVRLSGSSGPMSGFISPFLMGPSGVAATLSYSWPIWGYLDGIMHYSFGNVFDRHFEGFGLDQLRMSAGFGVAAITKRDHFFEFLVGFGTETFEDGAQVDSFRFTFGGRREF